MEANKEYQTILADPPTPCQQTSLSRGSIRHYRLMPIEEIKAMPVAELAAENSHLWLWSTAAALRDSYDIAEAWGFTPRSILIWIKPRMGLGAYLRNTAEFMIFSTRGKAPIRFKSQPNWLFAPVQEHSHKPEEQYAIIERCSPGSNRLELFARRYQPGWDAWGDELLSGTDLEIPGYPVPKYKNKQVGKD